MPQKTRMMFCLLWIKAPLFIPGTIQGTNFYLPPWRFHFMTSRPWDGKDRIVLIASGQTVAIISEIWQKKKQCPSPLSLFCFKAFPCNQTQVWEGLGHHGVGSRHFACFSWKSPSVPLRGFSLPWARADENTCVTAGSIRVTYQKVLPVREGWYHLSGVY